MEMTGGEAVVAALDALDVDHVFGIVSIHNIPIYDAIAREGRITMVSVRHEQGAVHAADGYARATGKLGVAIVSTGPGTTNAMTGLFEAGFASSPVLLITGQIESTSYGKGKGALHEAERQLPMLATVTRLAETVRRTEEIASTVVRLGDAARTGRPQPVAVEIPVDLQYRRAEVEVPKASTDTRIRPEASVLVDAAAALSGASRPVIWAGGGVSSSAAGGADGPLVRLAERLQAPVATTLNGRGSIPEDHPLSIGATTATPAVGALLAEADVIFAVGTRFQAGDTRTWALSLPGRLVHIDADPGVLGRSYPPAVSVVGDASLSLEGVLEALQPGSVEDGWLARAQEASRTARAEMRKAIGPDHEQIMDIMRELLPRDGRVVRDATIPAYFWGDRLIPIYEPHTSMRPTSAAIGPGVPLGIGAALGSGRPTVVIQGDGGLMLNVGEFATAAQHTPPLIVCIFNDRGYGILRNIQSRTFEGRQTGVDLATPDFVALARSMGLAAEPVDTIDGFREAFARALASGGPTVLEIDLAALPLRRRPE